MLQPLMKITSSGRLRSSVAEGTATALLLSTVVGSGIMGSRLSGGDPAMTLLANSLATGLVLSVLIMTFAPFSGAHMNPVISLFEAWSGRISWRDLAPHVAAQCLGAIVGVALAHLMFGEPLFAASRHARSGAAQLLGEVVATFGLVAVVRGGARGRPEITALAVGGYIAGAYWFTSSTSFANPAVTLARSLTPTFAGIRPLDVPGFVAAQIAGAAGATLLFNWLEGKEPRP